jgi:hypothetical protein
MADITPNPYSPYATADPALRHLIPIPRLLADLGVRPDTGALATTSCGQLAVVPDDAIMVDPGHPFPPIACPACIAAMKADRIDETPRDIEPCPECARPTPYGLCIVCRQDQHNEWRQSA